MPRHSLWWTFFSISRQLEKLPASSQIWIKRILSRINRELRSLSLPAVDNGDYVTFRIVTANMFRPDRTYFTDVVYFHKYLYTLKTTTDFIARCRAVLPTMRKNLYATAQKRGYPESGVLNFLHFVAIPGIASECCVRTVCSATS